MNLSLVNKTRSKGYEDARQLPCGPMSAEEAALWTAAGENSLALFLLWWLFLPAARLKFQENSLRIVGQIPSPRFFLNRQGYKSLYSLHF